MKQSLIELLEKQKRPAVFDFPDTHYNAGIDRAIEIIRHHQAEQAQEATMNALLDTLSQCSIRNGGLITWEQGMRAIRERFSIFWKGGAT